ncbi:hypothetical protein BCR36DRAFT_323913 [Piromyces finnis]|uniref:Tuberous sclerosis 1 n=1 Tax=Piromyces finnis TaxID=1754191 RepID=A0A1Y1VCJ7_9FUNG|nr:hypothetical protein BCR36DRAFT_323913 [Piromyces finnis]|eukprot:ORX52907.1 hypothetical protein BCR36DRAFT_323913 [Piromyces finnis]
MAKEVFKIISNDVKLKSNKNSSSSERIINNFVNSHLYEKVVYETLNNINNETENQNKDDFKKISSITHAYPTVDRLHLNLIDLFKSTFNTIENFNKENILVIKRLSMDPKLLIFIKYLYRLQDVFEPRKFMSTWWNALFKPILLNSRWRELIKVTQNIIIHFCIGNEAYKNTDIEDIIKEYQGLIVDTYVNEQKSIISQLSKTKKIENKLYDTTFSANLENLVIQIGISKPKEIFQDLNEQFNSNNRLEVINIINKIVIMEQFPVHMIVETNLFNSILCSIAVDDYAPIVCGCLNILTILIPRIFNHLPKILDELFSLLIRSILWERHYVKIIKNHIEEINLENQNKDYTLKEKHQDISLNNLMTLYSSQTLWNTVLNYFTFLYGMFPCNLLSFTKKLFEDFKLDSEKEEDIITNNKKLRKYIFKNIPHYSPEKDEIEGYKKFNDVFSSIRYIPKNHTSDIHYLEQAFHIIMENFLVHPNLMFSNTEKEKTDLSKWIQEDAAVITISCLSLYRPQKLDKKVLTTITNATGYNNDDENATEISFIKHNSYDSKVLPTWNMTQLNMALSNVTPSHSRAWAHESAGPRLSKDNRYSWRGIDDEFSEKILDFSLEGNNVFEVDKEIKKMPNFDTNIWYNVTNSNLSQRRKFTNKTHSHIDRRKIVPEDDLKYTEHYIKVHNFEKQATLDNFLNNNDNSQTFGSYNSKEPTEIEQRFINSDSIENIYSNSTIDDGFTKSILNNKSSMNNITVVSVNSNTDKQSFDDSIVSEIKNDKIINKSLSSIISSISNDTTTNDEIVNQNQTQAQKPKSSTLSNNNKFSTSTSISGLNASGNGITAQTSTTVMSSNLSAIHHYQSHGNIQSILQQKSISQIINEGNNNNSNNNNSNNNNNNNNNNNSTISANNTNSLFNILPGMDPHLNSLTNDANTIINIFSELRTSLSSYFYSLKILNESDVNIKNNKDKSMNNATLSSNASNNNFSSISALNETIDNITLQLDISRIHIFLLLNDLNYETYLRQSYLYSIRKLKKDYIAMEYKKNENLALIDKAKYQNQEIIYLQEQLDCQRVELHAIKDRYNSYQEGLTQQLYSLSKKNAESVDTIARLKDHLLECENIINNQKNRLDQANEKIFQLENCINVIKPQMNKQEEMEKQIEQLTKQLLLWEDDSEANEVTLEQMEEMANQIYNLEMIINSYKKELTDVKLALSEKNTLNNSLITKIANMERSNEKEESSKNEYTEVINRQRSLFDQQVQILEDKYQGVKQINLQLEMQIMNLQCDLEKANLENTRNKQVIERMNKEKLELSKETAPATTPT